ncbi:OmpA family protein [Thiohalomonas denitrificans]|uniref:OmpA family protein n=1 Tax=Thiohalomonas denitrificans TaxID=415747 RepID=UPI0026F0C8F8|nr:OmpA family protein [Thiohalomonas denitrificans]
MRTAWRRAAGLLAGGIVVSARSKQPAADFAMKADRAYARLHRKAGLPMAARQRRGYGQAGFRWLWLSLLLLPIPGQAVPPGTVIENTASATFSGGITRLSNMVSTVTVARTPSSLEFLQYAPESAAAQAVAVAVTEYSTSGMTAGPFVAMSPPTAAGNSTAINLADAVPLELVTVYHAGAPIFVRVTDRDQNLDAGAVETVNVTLTVNATGDREVLRLQETGPNTGVFTGYIQSYLIASNPGAAQPANGQLGLHEKVNITGRYVDVVDDTDTTTESALVDPFGVVFDSSTGQVIDGARVTLIDAATNRPATVYGDDGISTFPSTITSGGSATDSAGTVYQFDPGRYRFPVAMQGTYRLEVTPPAGYSAPSVVPTAVLQNLPGAPYVIDEQGSRGEPFEVVVGPAIQVDIPLDPRNSGLFLVKEVNKSVAAVGDFIQYRLGLTNDAGVTAGAPQIIDTLPAGFRYQHGSTTLDGNAAPEPEITADGRTLTFTLDDLPEGNALEVRYVVEIAAGVQDGEAINHAVASANGGRLVSNPASASVRVSQELLRDQNILMGRVIAGECEAPESDIAKGVAGVRLYLDNGTYVVTDEQGMFHLEGIRPGSHVVQMDLNTLAPQYEPVICDEHTRFAGRSFSRFIDLQGGTLWRTDFHVRERPPPTAEVELSLGSGVEGHMATYHVAMKGGDVPLQNMRLMISLPPGTRYLPGSSVLDDRLVGDPEQQGSVLVYALGEIEGAWDKELNFLAEVEVKGESALLQSKAFMMFDSPEKKNQRTPVVETVMKRLRHEKQLKGEKSLQFETFSTLLTERDREELERVAEHLREHRVIRIEATGHTDNLPIRERSNSRFADNMALSTARAREVGEYLVTLLELPDSALVINGMGANVPYAPNATEQGRSRNRRVELRIVTESLLDASQLNDITTVNNIVVEVEGEWKQPPVPERKTSSEEVKLYSMPDYDKARLESAEPGLELLWPPEGYNPPIPSIKVAVKHDPAQHLSLFLNGQPVSELNRDSRIRNAQGTVAVSSWAGVDIDKGSNTLVAEVRDADGTLLERLEREVRLSSLPVRAELVEEQSRLVADGRQTPVIAVRLFDKDDRPVREGLIGEFFVEAPHVAQLDVDDLQRQPLTGLDRGNPRYRVGKDGIALIELKPTTTTGEAILVLPMQGREVTLRPWLEAAQRDWILVGLAEGTVGHNTVSGNLETLEAADLEKETYSDGKVSFFAKGSIKGEWLLTLAYDSDKQEAERNTLFQEIDPDSYFPVYGDKSTQGYDAASREKLYVRLERRQFYALFGDYTTGLTVTELARYDRSLTGVKSELHSEHFKFNVFASENDQNFVRDELRGDGTSGLYRLRYPDLVFNSDKVRIETRDRFRPQLVLSSRPMTRHLDYNIDYDAGTLYFKQPVASKDAKLNPIYIVVDYETRNEGVDARTWGGRGAVQLLEQKVEVGASYINEGRDSGEETLQGLDAIVDFSLSTQMKLEYATSQSVDGQDSDAYLAELRHTSGKVDGRAYYREQEVDFGLGQQSVIGSGTRLVGIDGRYHHSDTLDYVADIFREKGLQTQAERDVIDTGVVYDTSRYGASAGLVMARDSYRDGTEDISEQLSLGAHRAFLDNRLELRIDHYQSLSSNENPDYPTRTLMGGDYRLNPSTALFLEQEFTFGEEEETRATRLGMKHQPWTGATLNSSLEQQNSEAGERLFANAGLMQTWQVTERWSMNASIDNSTTIEEPEDASFGSSFSTASTETEDFTAVSLGANYQHQSWSWTSRVEQRDAKSEDKWGFYSATAGEPRKGLGLSARLELFETQSTSGVEEKSGDLRLGLVRRPFGRRWTILNRADYAVDTQTGGTSDFDNWKVVNNLLVNYRRRASQISTYYGAKYVRDTIDSTVYSGYTDSLGVESRHDLNKRWDIGARASTLRSVNSDLYEYSYGLSVGFNPATNLWLSVGYNWAGYEDDDFSLAGYAAKGPYLKLRFKFDQQSLREVASGFTRH